MILSMALRRMVLPVLIGAGILQTGSGTAFAQAGGGAAPGAPAARLEDSTLSKSAHAKLVCVACHTSLDPQYLASAKTVAPVNCLRCHADAQFKHDFHAELAQAIRANGEPRVTCKECHGTHDISRPGDAGSKFHGSRVVESCGKCHERAAGHFKGSAHAMALAAGAKGAPTCVTCHRARITSEGGPADSLALKGVRARLCLTCHLDTPEVRERTSPDAGFVTAWERSKHGAALARGKAGAASCVECHGSHEIRKAADSASHVNRLNVSTTCAACHEKEKTQFSVSVHGLAKDHAKSDSLACSSCHGEHGDPLPPAGRSVAVADSFPTQICQRCHAPVVLSGTYGLASDRFRNFSDSYHGLMRRGDAFLAANCASCHTAHDVKPVKDTASSVNKANRAATCGKCHQHAIERFALGSVHDTSRAAKQERPEVAPRRMPAALIVTGLVAVALLLYGPSRRALWSIVAKPRRPDSPT